ncbi:MAG: hypothetical protein ABIH83_00780 [Candidatus Micrarchaeota archaeon]
MMDKEEIAEFRKKHLDLEKEIKEIGEEQIPTIIKLSKHLKGLMENIEFYHETGEDRKNLHINTKIKIAKRGVRLSKNLINFEGEVVKEFKGGSITESVGRKIISVTKLIKSNKMPNAKQEFDYFQKIMQINAEYEEAEKQMEKIDREFRKERHRIKEIMENMSIVKTQTVDLEKARKYEELLKNLKKLEQIRQRYYSSLASEQITKLLEDADSLKDYFQVVPKKEEIDKMRIFFLEYPELGKYNAGQICKLFGYSEKKILHVCPEASRFKSVILSNKKWFEALNDIKQIGFLPVDDEKTMDYYAKKIEGAKDVVMQIRLLRKEGHSCKEEYEKKKKIERMRKELSGYSRNALEAELEKIESLTELLHASAEEKKEKDSIEEEDGLLSKIASFFGIKK